MIQVAKCRCKAIGGSTVVTKTNSFYFQIQRSFNAFHSVINSPYLIFNRISARWMSSIAPRNCTSISNFTAPSHIQYGKTVLKAESWKCRICHTVHVICLLYGKILYAFLKLIYFSGKLEQFINIIFNISLRWTFELSADPCWTSAHAIYILGSHFVPLWMVNR